MFVCENEQLWHLQITLQKSDKVNNILLRAHQEQVHTQVNNALASLTRSFTQVQCKPRDSYPEFLNKGHVVLCLVSNLNTI